MSLLDDRNLGAELREPFPVPAPAERAEARLRHLLDGPHRGCFDVVAAPDGIDGAVRGVTIWDPLAPHPLSAGDLVLVTAPGLPVAEARRLMDAAAPAGVTAVVVKGITDLIDLAGARALANRAGVALLAAADALCWDDICLMARSLIPAARLGGASGRPWPCGLFELAEAAAALLGAPVEIADADLRVLSFANLDHPVDRLRTESIMARRAPEHARAWLESSGALARLRHGREVTRVELPGASPRLIAPVVARDTVVGYVCVAEAGRPLTDRDVAVLTDVAGTAAAHVVTMPLGRRDVDLFAADLFTSDLLRGVLDGRGSLDVLARRSGRAGGDEWCLVALGAGGAHLRPGETNPGRIDPGGANPGGIGPDDGAFASCARMLRAGSTATVLGGRVFVLVPHLGGPPPTDMAGLLRTRCSALSGGTLVACVSEPFGSGEDLTVLRRLLDRAVTVLASEGGPAVATLAELRSRTVLAELGEMARQHPSLLVGALDALRKEDSPRNTEYLTSLLAWFDAGCDLTEAAKRMRIHRNTLRYRLQRIEALCGVSLERPVERFTVELQVRLLALGAAG